MVSLEKHLKHKSHILWDWNGTLLDDLELCAGIMREMMVEHGLDPISLDEHRKKFRLPVEDFYKDLGFDLGRVEFKHLAEDFVKKYRERFHLCRLFQGTSDLLASLQKAGKRQAVLSAAREKELHYLVQHFELSGFFDLVFGLADSHAISKVERGKELLEQWKAPREKAILVGDMDHDRDVAKALGIEILLVDNGHQDLSHWITDPTLAVHPRRR